MKYVDPTGMETTYTLTLYNIDPTPNSNKVAAFGPDPDTGETTIKAGHTWMSLSDGEKTHHRGWGALGDPDSGGTVEGQLLDTLDRNQKKRDITQEFEIQITKEEYDAMMEYWNGLLPGGTEYHYAGSSGGANALNCTEAVMRALMSGELLSSAEEEIIKREYRKWSSAYPESIPQEFKSLAEKMADMKAANPNEFAERIVELNKLLQ